MNMTWRSYRTFATRRYCFIEGLIIPIALMAFHYALTGLIGPINIINVSVLHLYLLAYGDYVTFNGVTGKEYCFGFLRCSSRGEKCLMRAVAVDQVMRLIMVVFTNVGCGVVAFLMDPAAFTTEYILLHITMVIWVYAGVTATLLLARYLTTLLVYGAVAGLLVTVFACAISVGIGLLWTMGVVSLTPWIIGGLLLSVVSVVASVYLIRRNYLRSFLEVS